MDDYIHIQISESFESPLEAEKFLRALSRMKRELQAEYGEHFHSRTEPTLEKEFEFVGVQKYKVLARFSAQVRNLRPGKFSGEKHEIR